MSAGRIIVYHRRARGPQVVEYIETHSGVPLYDFGHVAVEIVDARTGENAFLDIWPNENPRDGSVYLSPAMADERRRQFEEQASIAVSAAQLEAAFKELRGLATSSSEYDLTSNSCVSFTERVLSAGGFQLENPLTPDGLWRDVTRLPTSNPGLQLSLDPVIGTILPPNASDFQARYIPQRSLLSGGGRPGGSTGGPTEPETGSTESESGHTETGGAGTEGGASTEEEGSIWVILDEQVEAEGGGGCFPAGTSILMYNGTMSPIESISPGDLLTSCDGEQLLSCAVLAVHSHPAEPAIAVELEGMQVPLKVTPNHRVQSSRGWVRAGELADGDTLCCIDSASCIVVWRRVTRIEAITELVPVFDLSVESPNTYVADYVVVHNKEKEGPGETEGGVEKY